MRLVDLDLEVYQGPFDLLFTLILKEEVDIFEVPLLEVITGYLEQLAESEAADWESLTEFMVLIGSLLHVKVRRLLPGRQEEEAEQPSPEEAREQLLARLLEYQRIKGAASYLGRRALEQCGRLPRPFVVPAAARLCPLEEVKATESAAGLALGLQQLLEISREPDTAHMAPVRVELKRQLAVLRRLVLERPQVSFQEAFGREEPLLQAVTLLAVLELLGKGELEATQAAPFADIYLRSVPRA